MLKEREPIIEKFSILVQVMLTLLCFWGSLAVTHTYLKPIAWDIAQFKILSLIIILLWILLLEHGNLGRIGRIKMYSVTFVEYLTLVIVGNVLLFALIELLEFPSVSRLALGVFAVTNFIALYSFKYILLVIMKFFRRKGLNTRQVLVIADSDSWYFIDNLIKTKDWGYKISAIMSNDESIIHKYAMHYTIIPHDNNLSTILDDRIIDEVFYCKSSLDQNEIQNYIYSCAEVGVVFRMQSMLLNYVKMQSTFSFLNQMPFLTFRNTPNNYLALKVKDFIDFSLSLIVIILLSPLILIISLLIKLNDGGPVFFLQKRVGLHGRHFYCYKFRTMVINAESLQYSLKDRNEQPGPVFKIKNDPRVTTIGRFLRKTSLDELPQFLNVLKGEMSVVGPRPPVPSEVKQYERWQQRRLSMKPGITCIWQVSGRNNIPFDQWMKMDMQYIDTWSPKLDFIIILKTIKVVFAGDGQ